MNQLPDHFYMAPSAASRWLNCPGSLKEAGKYPDEAGEAAELGTLAHAMVEADLSGEELDPHHLEYLNSLTAGQREWTTDAVDLCVEIIAGMGGDLLLEVKFQHDFLAGEHGGTVDVVLHNPGVLHVVDFKFGSVPVPVEDNAQIKCYLNLARQRSRFADAEKFYGSIIQPAVSDKIQTVEFSAEELEAHEVATIEASISDEFKAGDHCKWCPALVACQTAARYLHEQVKDFPDLTEVSKEELPSAEMLANVAKAYKVSKMAERVTEGAGPLIKAWAQLGANVRAHDLTVSNTQRQVWDEGAEEWLIGKGVSPDHLVKETLVTPAQLRAALELSKEQFADKYPGTIKLVPCQRLTIGKVSKECTEFDEL